MDKTDWLVVVVVVAGLAFAGGYSVGEKQGRAAMVAAVLREMESMAGAAELDSQCQFADIHSRDVDGKHSCWNWLSLFTPGLHDDPLAVERLDHRFDLAQERADSLWRACSARPQ